MSTSFRNDFITTVTKQVRFSFDRKIIALELEDHIKELETFYIEEVYDKGLAHEKAISEMGDPVEIGIALNKVHKPIWGWLWLISKAICIGLACVVFLMSAQRLWNAFQASQRHGVPTETAAEIFTVLGLNAETLDLITDQSPKSAVKLNGDTLIFDRFLLNSDGKLIILYQDVKSFDAFLIGSDHYPLKDLSILILPDGQELKFKRDTTAMVGHHHVLIAESVPTEITRFDYRFDGYSNTFTLRFNWGN